MTMNCKSWTDLWFDSAALAFEASEVMALRLNRLAMLDSVAMQEAQLMVTEKVAAAMELNVLALTGRLGRTPDRQARGTVGRLRTKVARNRRRLTASKLS